MASQQRAAAAIHDGFFDAEIAPHTRADGSVVTADDGPRRGTTLGALAVLNPAFLESATVTAGNAGPLNDGASAPAVVSTEHARRRGWTRRARILEAAASALSPEIMGLGPIAATRRLLALLDLTVADLGLVELNEAFAARVVPVVRELELDADPASVNGGAITLGHPFGATGVRLVGALVNSLDDSGGRLGLATLCVGGGQGMAILSSDSADAMGTVDTLILELTSDKQVLDWMGLTIEEAHDGVATVTLTVESQQVN